MLHSCDSQNAELSSECFKVIAGSPTLEGEKMLCYKSICERFYIHHTYPKVYAAIHDISR